MELASRQHGLVTTRQLKGIGYSRSSASKANGVGRLHRLYRGVYVVGHQRMSWESRCLAAVLACAPAAASHFSAGWLLGLLQSRPGTVHLSARTRRHRKPGLKIHFAPLQERDLTVVDQIPVTAVPRTVLDLAATLSPVGIERVLERAEAEQLFDLGPMLELLARAGHHPGAAKLRRALGIYREEPAFLRSRLERRFLDLVRKTGLPPPAMNFNVAGFELDAYWEPERFAVELDVFETHGSRAAFERDRVRQEDLKLVGVEMTRITGARLDREPAEVMRRVAALLAQRRAELS